jgi:DNA replication protein DnaC
MDKLMSWADSYTGDSALLLGPTGCGKTRALYRAFGQDGECDITRAATVAQCVSYGHADVVRLLVRGYLDAGPLGIDDLGWEPDSGIQAIREVIARRYEKGLATVVTSGQTIDKLCSRYSDAVIRRILHNGVLIDCWEK